VHGKQGCLCVGYGLHDGALCSLVQIIQFRHVVLVKLEAIDVDVAGDSGWCIALGKRHESLLQTPSDEDLVGLLVVLLGDGDEGLVLALLVANDGAVGFDDNVVLLAVLDTVALLAPGVKLIANMLAQVVPSLTRSKTYLDLVDDRCFVAEGLDLINLMDTVVADTNIPHLAFLLCLLQGLPHQLPSLFTPIRTVNEEQVRIAALPSELFDTLGNLLVCRLNVLFRAKDLGRDINLLSWKLAFSQRAPDFSLIRVVLSGIDVPVACLEGLFARIDAYVRG
jgi:hypothetical protein